MSLSLDKLNGFDLESIENRATYLEKIYAFLKEIGIDYYITDKEVDSFLKGVQIEYGKLKINPRQLLCVGDILHEAGHLACLPANLRMKANEDIGESIGEDYTFEMGVIAYSVAAAHHLNIPLSEIFHEESYKGEARWLLDTYSSNNHLGVPLLQWMGMAAFEDEATDENILPYPKMLRWTRM